MDGLVQVLRKGGGHDNGKGFHRRLQLVLDRPINDDGTLQFKVATT
jgi:hypothetical protein